MTDEKKVKIYNLDSAAKSLPEIDAEVAAGESITVPESFAKSLLKSELWGTDKSGGKK